MARDYAKKLARARVYSKTPAGRAAKKRSHDNYVIKRGTAIKELKINPHPLLKALANWTQP